MDAKLSRTRSRTQGARGVRSAHRKRSACRQTADVQDPCAEYVPIDYAVDGVIRTGSLYTLTGPTGSGKTAFNVIAALAIETWARGHFRPPRH